MKPPLDMAFSFSLKKRGRDPLSSFLKAAPCFLLFYTDHSPTLQHSCEASAPPNSKKKKAEEQKFMWCLVAPELIVFCIWQWYVSVRSLYRLYIALWGFYVSGFALPRHLWDVCSGYCSCLTLPTSERPTAEHSSPHGSKHLLRTTRGAFPINICENSELWSPPSDILMGRTLFYVAWGLLYGKGADPPLMSFLRSDTKQPYEELLCSIILICLLTCRLQLKIRVFLRKKIKTSKIPPKMQSYTHLAVSIFKEICL